MSTEVELESKACLRSRVSSVNQGVDFFGRLVLVETGATESRSETTAESPQNVYSFFSRETGRLKLPSKKTSRTVKTSSSTTKKMSSKPKKHRAMGDDEWMSRLRRFAASGVWASEAGNRPAPRQKKWHDLYLKIEKCPQQQRGQMSLFGGTQACNCGFHTNKPSSSVPVSSSGTPQPGPSSASPMSAAVKPGRMPQKPILTLSSPLSGTSQPSSTVTSAMARRTPSPSRRMFIQTVSPLSLPPSPVPSTSSIPLAASRAEVSSAASSCIPSGTSSAPLAPVTSASASASAGVSSAAPSVDGPTAQPVPVAQTAPGSEPGWLPAKLIKTIPAQDQKWISAALWKNQRLRTDLKLWYDPPDPALIYHQAPNPERFFTHRLLVWMPYHLWKVRLTCPVCGKQLTSYGAHKRARLVLDVDRYYLMITETLWCSSVGCKTTYLSTSKTILDQLDLALRLEFRLILTRKYACDVRVIRFLRERALGNSPTRLVRQLTENHSEEWLKRSCRYLGACSYFAAQPSLLPVKFQDPPEPIDIPSHRWMLAVYGRDILTRLDHIKASITCIFGSVLKMDSTKKITKKLSGIAKGTALWLTSVSNERCQILISVLTAQEGSAVDTMATDLIRRYSDAGVAPPQLLYVDCDCCREGSEPTKLQKRFGGWPDLIVKLDIYHFMRRLAAGCTKDAHPLYPMFMAKLSVCIFEWDRGDVALLRQAKWEQLRQERVPGITESLVDEHITKAELVLHCRRQTRGERQTIIMIEQLLSELIGVKGRDFLGVPLLDQERMQHIWQIQQRHVKCIQDEPCVLLYVQTGITTKAGIVLPNYRCARGSTSLESFHLHVNRFIPGTSANCLNFQLYLLEGLNRWNQDREAASLAVKPPSLLSYSGDLVHCVNTHSVNLLGRKLVPSFQPPSVYTGELIGIDYLFRQTGKALQDVHPDLEETDQMLEDVSTEEGLEDEGFDDTDFDPTVEVLDLSSDRLSVTTSSAQVPPTSLKASAGPAAPAATAGPFLSPPSTVMAPQQQLAFNLLTQKSSATSSASVPPLPTTLTTTVSAATATTGSQTPAAPGQQLILYQHKTTSSGPSAATSTTAAPPYITVLPNTLSTQTAGPSGAPAMIRAAPEQQLQAVDEQGIPGMERVDSMAEYLVGLRTVTGQTLSNQQASTIIALWQNLLPYDQQRVVYAARHQVRLTTGRFRVSKKRAEFTPGVESMTRCFLASSGSPAQWPGCSRLVESICVKLCNIHKSPKKQGSYALTRWTLIVTDYGKIRQLVLGNATVMQSTALQLFDINQTTLVQWHNRRLKRQDSSILLQGVNLPAAIPVAPAPLPPVQMRPTAAPPHPGPHLQYHLPQSTAGQAVVRRKSATQRQLFPQPAPTPSTTAQTPGVQQIAPSGPLPSPPPVRRTYTRTVAQNKCSRCQQPRNTDTGHRQYYGHIYCPQKNTMPVEQWMEEMRRKRAEKK
ncbi:uncharacterized protein LOC115566827 isoform X3 [Sparus aurata]|uniref:uncharacterized protein LOC115566827 isoform X3 n=1 Tax=Sparus aurata TaxID=8175 RepID=UPI0011C1BD1C|nr:uncharacterized protein LOC115566827 isoform X3 [Sparus aurata]